MSQLSEAETVPGDAGDLVDDRVEPCQPCPSGGHAAPVEDSQVQRALWMRPAAPLPLPNSAPVVRPRTYRSLRPHMQLLAAKSFSLPRSMFRCRSGGSGPAPEMQYIPVKDPAEGLSYMMCAYCKGDRIYRVFQNFLRHLESGECPAGQQELLRLRSDFEAADAVAPPALPAAPPRDVAPVEPLEPLLETSFKTRRALLSELRLLQPKRYAELAVDALGLLNRSIQDLLLLLHRARADPKLGPSEAATVRTPKVHRVQRHPVEALADRLKGQGLELRPLFSFEECRSEFLLRESKLLPREVASAPAQPRRRAAKRPCEESASQLVASQLVPLDLV